MSEWNGVPLNEEYRGWHWLYLYNGIPIPAYWDDHWLINGEHLKVEDLNPQIKYWGKCLTPSEIEAKEDRIAELEAALRQIIGTLDDPTGGQHVADMRAASSIAIAALGGVKQ